MYEPAWKNALEKLGNNVYIFNPYKYFKTGLIGRAQRKYGFGYSISKIRSELILLTNKLKPDLILIYQGHFIDAVTISKLKKITWVTGYHNDNPFISVFSNPYMSINERVSLFCRYRHLLGSLPYYNSYHVYRESNIDDAKKQGVKHVACLKAYYIPELDHPINKTDPNLGADIIFAGHPEPDGRENIIEKIIDSGINIKLYGDGIFWRKLLKKEKRKKINSIKILNPVDYRIALNSSKICLCFFSKRNNDTYTRRVFEITAMRKFLLAERTDTMLSLYKEGIEAEYFSSYDELKDKIKFYLKNEQARIKIEKTGYKRCINAGYDVESRMKQWIKDVKKWQIK